MKNTLLILVSLFSIASFSYADDDSAASDIGCGGKPKPMLPEGGNMADITCVCSGGVCNWVYTGN